jgi:hypothetical protein
LLYISEAFFFFFKFNLTQPYADEKRIVICDLQLSHFVWDAGSSCVAPFCHLPIELETSVILEEGGTTEYYKTKRGDSNSGLPLP